MSALGWSENSGLGGNDLSGNPNHITVARKLDNGGIGVGRARKEGDDAASGAGMAGAGLKRLAEAAAKAEGAAPAEAKVEVKTEVVPARNRIAYVNMFSFAVWN
jgi:Pin2-interacting protein X1